MQKYLLHVLGLTILCTFMVHTIDHIDQSEALEEQTRDMQELHNLQELVTSTPFVQLVHSFISIFQKTFIACSAINLDPSCTDTGISTQDIMKIIEQNPALKDEILCLLKRHSHLFIVTRGSRYRDSKAIKKADQQEVQTILMSFVGIVQCFCRMVQDPENRENITHELLGMLANLLQAGKVIFKKNSDTSDQDIKPKNELTIFSVQNK